MNLTQYSLAFLAALVGGSYGTVFGGGSFMTLPVLFLTGIDPRIAMGTNRFGTLGMTLSSFSVYQKKKHIHWPTAKFLVPFFTIGTIVGALLLGKIEGEWIKRAVSWMILLLAVFDLFYHPKTLVGATATPSLLKRSVGTVAMVLIGTYSILISASSGTMIVFTMIYLFGLDAKNAITTRPAVTLLGNCAALAIILYQGLVDFKLGIPLFLGWGLGGFLGARFVTKIQSQTLHIIFSVVVIFLAIKSLFF